MHATVFAVALVVGVVTGGIAVLGISPGATPVVPTSSGATAAAASPPTIFGFFASPSEILEGQSTFLIVSASGTGTLDYSFSGLPAGCPSSDTSFLYCAPSGYGYFNITVSVTNGGSGPAAVAYTALDVDPVITGNFFTLNQSVASWSNASTEVCSSIQSAPFYQYFCDPQVQQPSLLPLKNGSIAVAYQQETTVSSNACAGSGATVARVEYQVSGDNGSTWGNTTDIGNDTCAYLNAIEPSFSVSNHYVYGAFVEENSSALPWNYVSRPGDAIGFVGSSDSGTTFRSAVTVRATGNLAEPEIAAVGKTVYLVYEDIANSSLAIGGNVLPISVWFQKSTDAGRTWTSAQELEGLGNSADGYTAAAPAVGIDPTTGAVTVAYATDRACLATNATGCAEYGDSIVSITSTDNGTAWSSPVTVATGAGENACLTGGCFPGYFESVPEITLAYAPTGSLYLAYAAAYDQGGNASTAYNDSGVYAAESGDDGSTWSVETIEAPGASLPVRSFEPGLAASGSDAYLTFLEANQTAGTSGFANSLSNFVTSIPVGDSSGWSAPSATGIESFVTGGSVNATESSYAGPVSAVAVTALGRPMIAFALPGPVSSSIARSTTYYYANTTTPSQLEVGALVLPTDPTALTETFQQTGIPGGLNWTFSINGVNYVLPTYQVEFDNIPEGATMIVGAYFVAGPWEIVSSFFNASATQFYFNSTTVYPFEIWVGVELSFFPSPTSAGWSIDPYGYMDIYTNLYYSPFSAYADGDWALEGDYYCYITCTYTLENYLSYFSSVSYYDVSCTNLCEWPTPWYFPLGSQMSFVIDEWNYYGLTPVYWTGQGSGSYTGDSQGYCYDPYYCYDYSGTITVNGPINETLWLADAPVNLNANLTFSASGLPSTSVYHFAVNGADYTGNANSSVEVANAAPGAYSVSSIWATSPKAGWEYFGEVNGPNPFLSPTVTSIALNFTALVHVSAAAGTVRFNAPGLAAGTVWSLTFNGTTYSSATPWINLTERPGTYPYSVGATAAPSGTAGYLPVTSGSSLSVVPGDTYTIDFEPAYLVRAVASPGGLVSVNGGAPQSVATAWVASDATVSLAATLSPGYSFVGWSGSGSGAYSGNASSASAEAVGPLVESAAFAPLPGARFNLTFEETGLPAGTWWSVDLGGTGHASDATSLSAGDLWPYTAPDHNGDYSLSVPDVFLNSTNLTRFVPQTLPSVIATNGSITAPVVVQFQAQSLFQLDALQGGVVEGTFNGAPTGSSEWIPLGSSVSFVATPNPGYTFAGWVGTGPGAYTGTDESPTISVLGPVTEVASFQAQVAAPPPRYTLTFDLTTPVASGTSWSIVLAGVGYSSSGTSLTVSGLLVGTYGVSIATATAPGGLVEYRPTATDPLAYTVRGNATVDIAFASYYWVSVSSSVGGSASPGNSYYASGSILYLVATPGTGDAFGGWTGAGDGSYNGTNATASLLVLGPLIEVASFHTSSTATAASSIWSNPETWLGIGAIALVAGLAVGLVVAYARRGSSTSRRGVAPPPSGPPPSEGAP